MVEQQSGHREIVVRREELSYRSRDASADWGRDFFHLVLLQSFEIYRESAYETFPWLKQNAAPPEGERWSGGQGNKNCLVIKQLARGLGESLARPMVVAI